MVKLAKIKKAVQSMGTCVIVNADGRQYVGTSGRHYLMADGLKMDEENALFALDIPHEKHEAIRALAVRNDGNELFSLEPCENDEELAEILRLVWRGREVMILRSENGGTIAMYADALEPIEAKEPRLFMRGRTIAVFEGLLCTALISPLDSDETIDVMQAIREAAG